MHDDLPLRSSFGLLLALLAPRVSAADPILASGSGLEIAYGADGLAYDPTLEGGIRALLGETPDWYDFTWYAGASTTIEPFLASSFSYERDGEPYEFAGYIQGSSGSAYAVDWTTVSAEDLSGDGLVGVTHVWEMGDLVVTKTETWEEDGYAARVHFAVTNTSDEDLERFAYLHLIDPADTSATLNSTNTRNDLQDIDGDGVLEYAQAQGRATTTRANDHTLALGLCDPAAEEVNFKSGVEVLVSEALDVGFDGDTDGASSDQQIVYLHEEETLEAGATVLFAFILAAGASDADALAAFTDARPGCWDLDADGELGVDFGGGDCDDEDGAVYAGADEIWYDGLDQDCAGDNDYDQDQDGFVDDAYSGAETRSPGSGEVVDDGSGVQAGDCDDEDASINAGIDEIWYDGLDQDCAGDDDYDQDQDGYADEGHADVYGPTRDPGSGEDIDGTGVLEPADCDDLDPEVGPCVLDPFYKGGGGCRCASTDARASRLGLVALLVAAIGLRRHASTRRPR